MYLYLYLCIITIPLISVTIVNYFLHFCEDSEQGEDTVVPVPGYTR